MEQPIEKQQRKPEITHRMILVKLYDQTVPQVPGIQAYGSLRAFYEKHKIQLSKSAMDAEQAALRKLGYNYLCPHTGFWLYRCSFEIGRGEKKIKRRCIVALDQQPGLIRVLPHVRCLTDDLGSNAYWFFCNNEQRKEDKYSVVFHEPTQWWMVRRKVISTVLPKNNNRGKHLVKPQEPQKKAE